MILGDILQRNVKPAKSSGYGTQFTDKINQFSEFVIINQRIILYEQ
jgi:hypothetical protein